MALFSNRAARARWRAGDRARDAGNWLDARSHYGEALKLSPSRYGLWMQYGHAAKESGDLAGAEAAYRSALLIDPNLADGHLHLAHLLKRLGRFREAEAHFAKLLQLQPGSETVRAELEVTRAHRDDVALDGALRDLGTRVKGTGPNLTHYGHRFANYEVAMLNIKNIGYALARALGENLAARVVAKAPDTALRSKMCTQNDMESDWALFWAQELKVPLRYHRKVWEFCYHAQALWHAGKLKPGMSGLGFGCGNEPLVGLYAKYGAQVLATDRPAEEAKAANWEPASPDLQTYRMQYADICPDPELRRNISFRPADMREIPNDLSGRFDFCWSACALEHLGSIEKGLGFIERSLQTLKPGGVAVHTTEFNLDEDETVDNWATVLFQRRHMVELEERLTRQGYRVAALDFGPGEGILDGFVDVPPWSHEPQGGLQLGSPDAHLKLALDGFVCTSFGLIVTAPG